MLTPAERRAIQRRLDRWELEHLRQHAAELAERLEEFERRAYYAEDLARSWREDAMQLQDELFAKTGDLPGLTRDGHLVMVAPS